MSETVRAQLANVAAAAKRQAARFEGFQAGGGGMVARPLVTCKDAAVRAERGGGLHVTFRRDGGSVEAAPAALELPGDWQAFARLRATVVNGPAPLLLHVVVLGARGRVMRRRRLAPGRRAVLNVPLGDLPLVQGARPAYQPAGVRLVAQWGRTWKTEAQRLEAGGIWPPTANNRPVTLVLEELALVPRRDADAPPAPVVDHLGQRRSTSWPGKARGEADLRRAAAEEGAALRGARPPGGRDRFGGWLAGPDFRATGFFTVARDDAGRWWFVDPLGRPFWSLGATGVRPGDFTSLAGREGLYEDLPDPRRFPAAYARGGWGLRGEERAVNFYAANVVRKYGSMERWHRRVVRRLAAWGMNTVANWSAEPFLLQRRVPHVRTLSTRLEGQARIANRMPDVWCPRWRAAFEAHVAEAAAAARDNPWLLGYFVDNEMPWGGLHKGAVLDCPPAAPARGAFLAFARRRFPSLAAFNRALGTRCRRWQDVRLLRPQDVAAGQAALREFVGELAERYFRTVAETLRKHDGDHLYLGCRFVRNRPDDLICAAAGRHCDVVTVNCYDLWPRREQFGDWHAACGGKPILVGEHQYFLVSPRQLPPPWTSFTAAERRRLYVEFVRKWAEQPYSLGCHWFQFEDQPATGRPGDGENQIIGLVDVTDRPHADMVAAVKRASAGMYRWHANARA